ncbi:MAG: FHA domain-containing protein [Oscillospiraceae bacterium]|nr:FHA domain-containing protein [Oscillospiraceae bacterium]
MLQVKQSAESEVVSQQNSASVPPVKSTTPVNAVLSESPVVSAVSAEKVSAQPTPPLSSGSEDIVIDLGGSKEKKKKKSGGLFGGKKEKPPAEPKRGLFGGKKTKSKEIIIGAGAENPVHLMESRVEENKVVPAIPVWIPMDEDESTQLDGGLCGAYLRLISDAPLPGNISVRVEQGRAFTIGRFDVSVGHKQSDFEFEKGTKAVSRRHAAIERDGDGYWIMDLSSSAGTFVNGEKLLPNMPKQLVRGCRVSFGTGGADYIWEE